MGAHGGQARLGGRRLGRRFAIPSSRQAKKDGRKIIYFRFAAHPELVPECPEVKRVIIPLSHRFETFTVEIHKVIEQEGKDAFYVFDCLSELQTAWATDLMMGNFFRVTCPFLFILDTVAFFPIIRGRHSFNAVNKIISTTQLFLDVYSDPDREDIYIRPQKVWNRTSDTMFLPHLYRPAQGTVVPVRDGVQTSRFTGSRKDLLKMAPEERAHEGIFLSFQQPVEIPGVSMVNFMRAALNAKRQYKGEEPLSAGDFLKLMREKRKIVELDSRLTSRSVNEGFSGGEKKRNEIFQMAMLEPTFSILDETDSGLDVDALRIVAEGFNKLRTPQTSALVITHYQRLLDYLKPDIIHVLIGGMIVKTAGPELALEIENRGFDWIKEEVGL